MCNKMKYTHILYDFIKYCKNIIDNYGYETISSNLNRKKKSYNEYKKNISKNRSHIQFSLTEYEYNDILLYNCFYCQGTNRSDQIGIDRVDPNIGYIYNNCVSCCSICNIMKYTYSVNDFINKLKEIILNNKVSEYEIGKNGNELLINHYKNIKKDLCKGYFESNGSYKKCNNYQLSNSLFCLKHKYFEKLSVINIKNLKICNICNRFHEENNDYCIKCYRYQTIYKIIKVMDIKCSAYCNKNYSKRCDKYVMDGYSFCKNHIYLNEYSEYELSNLTKCNGCKKLKYKPNNKSCNECRLKAKK